MMSIPYGIPCDTNRVTSRILHKKKEKGGWGGTMPPFFLMKNIDSL